jgi:hypothetical protein
MPYFYAAWLLLCAGWGYMAATTVFPSSEETLSPVLAFPLTLIGGCLLSALSFHYSPTTELADPPSIRLKPWNRPTGFLLFLALTFSFTGAWATGMVIALGLPGTQASLHVLALGLGPLLGIVLAPKLMPAKFKPSGATTGVEE